MSTFSTSFPAASLASGAWRSLTSATPTVKAPGIKSNVTGFQVHHEAMLGAATSPSPISLDVRIRYHRRDYNMIGGSTTSSMTYEFEFLSNVDGRLRVATRDGQDLMGSAKDDHGCEFPPNSKGAPLVAATPYTLIFEKLNREIDDLVVILDTAHGAAAWPLLQHGEATDPFPPVKNFDDLVKRSATILRKHA